MESMEQPNIKNMNIHNKAHTCSRGVLCTATVGTPKYTSFQGKKGENGYREHKLNKNYIHRQLFCIRKISYCCIRHNNHTENIQKMFTNIFCT